MIAMNTPRPVSTSRLNCLESKSVTEFSLIPTWDIIRAAKKINKPMITAIPISHFTNVNNFSGSSCLAIFFSKGINHFSFRFSNSAVVIWLFVLLKISRSIIQSFLTPMRKPLSNNGLSRNWPILSCFNECLWINIFCMCALPIVASAVPVLTDFNASTSFFTNNKSIFG